MTDEKIEKEPDMNQADKLMEKGKFMDSLRILNVLAQKSEGKDEELCEIYSKMSQAYYGLEKFRTNNSISYMEKCLALREKIGDLAGLALDYMNYAYLLDESGDSPKAIESIEKGIALAKKIEDDQLELAILSSKADILSGKKRSMNEAIDIFKEVLERSKKINDWDTYFEAEAGLIKVYREKGDSIKAFCPIAETKGNPVIEIAKFAILPRTKTLEIKRPEKKGGPIVINSAEELDSLYSLGNIHPMDLKASVTEYLIKILEPARGIYSMNS